MHKVIQELRTIFLRDGAGLTDGQLLESFVNSQDEAAFTALVRRHGPMVLGVCHRILRDYHDGEDAFQATFLVLARKAASIRPPEMVANWLYGVAYRTALKAKARLAKQRLREQSGIEMAELVAPEDESGHDLQPLLDHELSRLPDKYRMPVVLCGLEGKTEREAARQLGWPQGTLSGRLSRARAMLAKRLARHGLVLSAGSLATTLTQDRATACVSASLVNSTVKAATVFAAGQATPAGSISAQVAALAKGALKAMLVTKLKTGAAVLVLATAVVGMGTSGLLYYGQGAQHAIAGKDAAPTPQSQSKRRQERAVMKEFEKLQGTWVAIAGEANGRRATTERINATNLRLIIEGSEFVLKRAGKAKDVTGKLTIDPTKQPKTMDWSGVSPDNGERFTCSGIYQIEGDSLKFCYGHQRPKEFKPKPDRDLDERMYVFQRAEARAARIDTLNNLRMLAHAMVEFASNPGNRSHRLPPFALYGKDGTPLLSWRVLLLPYLDQEALYQEFHLDEPWDSPHNKRFAAKMPDVYRAPAGNIKDASMTLCQVFVGKGAAFEGTTGIRMPDDFKDSCKNTLLIVEAAEAVPWTKPADLIYDRNGPLPKLGGQFPDVLGVAFADCSVGFLRKNIPEAALRGFITRNGQERVNRDDYWVNE